jgi:hypothetical protein
MKKMEINKKIVNKRFKILILNLVSFVITKEHKGRFRQPNKIQNEKIKSPLGDLGAIYGERTTIESFKISNY